MDFKVSQAVNNDTAVISVSGEVDVFTAPNLREELLAAISGEASVVVVDMGEVTFLDSTGLGVLVGALKRARQQDKDLKLVVYKPQVLRVFQVTGLTNVFTILDSFS